MVNDGSTDDTAEVIRQFRDRICYVEKANGGKASAVNLGLKYVTGEYVWILDDDDIGLPNKLELHAAQFAEDPDLRFVYTGYESIEGERSDLPVRSSQCCQKGGKNSEHYTLLTIELKESRHRGMVLSRDLYEVHAHPSVVAFL